MQPYKVSPPPLSEGTRNRLREDGNFIGGMLILLITLLSFGFTVFALLAVAVGRLSLADLAAEDLGLGNTGFLLFYMGVYSLSMGLPGALGVILFRRSPRSLLAGRPVPAVTAVSGVLIGFSGCVGANLVANYVSQILEKFGIVSPDSPVTMEPTATSLALNLVVMAVLPALLEELLFRGLILQTLRPYGERLAVVLSALLFGLIHGGLTQSVFAFLVGLVLGWLAVSTGNIRPAIVLHFFNNAVSVLLQYAGLGLDDMNEGILTALVMYGLAAIGLIVLAVSARRGASFLRLPPRGQLRAGACAAAVWKTPLMVIATLLIVLRMIQITLF